MVQVNADAKVRMRKIAKPRYSGEPDSTQEGIPRHSGQNALVQHDINAESEDLIRKMLAEQRREYNRRQLPEITPDTPDDTHHADPTATSARAKRRKAWGKALNEIPENHFDVDTDEVRQPRSGWLARLLGSKFIGRKPARPSRVKSWHVILAASALLMVFKPSVIPGLLMGVFWAVVLFSLVFGPGRVFEFLNGAWDLFMRRNPALATALRDTRDAVVVGAVALLKRVPGNLDERWFAPKAEEKDDPFATRPQPKVFRG